MSERSPIEGRLDFFELKQDARAEFAGIARLIDRYAPAALAKFYDKVALTPAAARFFPSRAMMDHAGDKQLQHWRGIFQSSLDEAYYGRAENIGKVHARIGLDASLYFGAYAQILSAVIEKSVAGSICGRIPGVRRLARRISTLVKVALLDMDIAVTTIFQTKEDTQKQVIDQVGHGLQALAQGDLCVEIPTLPQEYRQLGDDFAYATTSLRDMISTVSRSFVSIHAGAREISAASNDLAHRTERQAAALEETAAALRDLAGSVRQTAQDAGGARETARAANSDAHAGGEIVHKAVSAMSQIDRSSNEIGAIVDVIDSIAFQTNLLALNAGIEAARAGNAGQGFAVVANEVRALAQRSADAAQDIKQLIGQSSGQVGAGVELVGETGRALEQIVERSEAVAGLVHDIAGKAEGQANSIQEVNIAVSQMDQMTQQNAAMVEQSTAAAASLAEQAARVAAVVARFKVDGPDQNGGRAVA